jgi:hypothetical protein
VAEPEPEREAARGRTPEPPTREDPEQTLSVRPRRDEPEPPEPPAPREPREAGDLFGAAPAESELPEPPALFITPAPAAAAGEVRVSPGSLEPREFPPRYEEPTPGASGAPFVAAPPAAADPTAAEPVFPGDVAEPSPAAPFELAGEEPGTPDDAATRQTAPSAAATAAQPPTGRALADLYYAQGHYAEALQIYDDLVTRHPFDEDLKRMRRDAEARLLPAASSPASATQDAGLERRLARVRVLKRWLGRIQSPGGPAAPPGP